MDEIGPGGWIIIFLAAVSALFLLYGAKVWFHDRKRMKGT